jgi:hypothetical protein
MSAFNIVREGIAYATLNVGNADVENIALTLVAGGSVAGRLRMDGAGDASSQSLAPNLKVQLNTSLNGVPANIPGIFRPRPGDVSGDGAFTIPNVRVGEYRVSVDGMPSGYYLKEARIGPNDVLNRPFQFTAGGADQNTIEIVLGTGAPSVSGTATNERLDAIPGALVVLVPERLRDRLDLYKTATADANGRFTISSVAPGDYKIFAWEALEPNAFFDPELLKQVDSRGKSVHLGELSAPTADVRVIPAESPF